MCNAHKVRFTGPKLHKPITIANAEKMEPMARHGNFIVTSQHCVAVQTAAVNDNTAYIREQAKRSHDTLYIPSTQ
jgi:hypothetical protein